MDKKIIAVLLVGLIGSLAVVSHYDAQNGSGSAASQSQTGSEAIEQSQVDIDFDLIPSVSGNDQLDKDKLTYLYFYQPDCINCVAIKQDIVDFYQTNTDQNLDFYKVDLTQKVNDPIWSKQSSTVGDKVETVTDLEVIGTPTLVTVKDGKIETVAVGKTDVEQAVR